jgi:predicted nucleic acid-binding protein
MTPDANVLVAASRADHPYHAVAHLGEHLVSFDRDFRKLLARGQLTLLAPA